MVIIDRRLAHIYSSTLRGVFNTIAPIKNSIIINDCEVHVFIQSNALNIIKNENYNNEYELFRIYIEDIKKGLIWADQDFKSYYHFYNPKKEIRRFVDKIDAMKLSKEYYNNAIQYARNNNYNKSMFYFGAVCHLVQDLTIPHHAKGSLLDNHRQFEKYIKLNYKTIDRFNIYKGSIIFNSIEDYIENNSLNALKIDNMHRGIKDLKSKFYLMAIKSISLAQKTTAGLMITFYKDINKLNKIVNNR